PQPSTLIRWATSTRIQDTRVPRPTSRRSCGWMVLVKENWCRQTRNRFSAKTCRDAQPGRLYVFNTYLKSNRFYHPFPHSLIGKASIGGLYVVQHVSWQAGAGYGTRNGRVRDDVLEKELCPRPAVELARPFRQCLRFHPLEKTAITKGLADDHTNTLFRGQRQQAVGRLSISNIVIHLDEVDGF